MKIKLTNVCVEVIRERMIVYNEINVEINDDYRN